MQICLGSVTILKQKISQKFSYKNQGSTHEGILIQEQGQFYAYKNRCAHMPMPLDWGDDAFFSDDGAFLICRNHAALFNPQDGVCVSGPCAGKSLEQMPLQQKKDKLYVTILPD